TFPRVTAYTPTIALPMPVPRAVHYLKCLVGIGCIDDPQPHLEPFSKTQACLFRLDVNGERAIASGDDFLCRPGIRFISQVGGLSGGGFLFLWRWFSTAHQANKQDGSNCQRWSLAHGALLHNRVDSDRAFTASSGGSAP